MNEVFDGLFDMNDGNDSDGTGANARALTADAPINGPASPGSDSQSASIKSPAAAAVVVGSQDADDCPAGAAAPDDGFAYPGHIPPLK